MPQPLTKLETVLWDLLDACLEGDAGELTQDAARRVRATITEVLEVSDSPSSRDLYQIADWIYWNCAASAREAAERWLLTLRVDETAELQLGDVLAALAHGAAGKRDGDRGDGGTS